ncbi:MAG: hypothetical protein AAGL49_05080 [Pseudomonadota bacterium]
MAQIYLHPSVVDARIDFARAAIREAKSSYYATAEVMDADEPHDKWPLAMTALFAVATSVGLWALLVSSLMKTFA